MHDIVLCRYYLCASQPLSLKLSESAHGRYGGDVFVEALVPVMNLTAGFPTVVVRIATLPLVERSAASLLVLQPPVQMITTEMTAHTMQHPNGTATTVTPIIKPVILKEGSELLPPASVVSAEIYKH